MMSGESYAAGKDNSLHGPTATLVNSIIREEVASLNIMFRNFLRLQSSGIGLSWPRARHPVREYYHSKPIFRICCARIFLILG